jgi:hypothetical protein
MLNTRRRPRAPGPLRAAAECSQPLPSPGDALAPAHLAELLLQELGVLLRDLNQLLQHLLGGLLVARLRAF